MRIFLFEVTDYERDEQQIIIVKNLSVRSRKTTDGGICGISNKLIRLPDEYLWSFLTHKKINELS